MKKINPRKLFPLLRIMQVKTVNGKKYERFNPYNPLTYVLIAVVFVGYMVYSGCKVAQENWIDMKDIFKYRRH